MILLIDNYDSFTYNLVQRIGELLVAQGHDPEAPDSPMRLQVVRNDKITVAEAQALGPSHVIVSPGPCTPNEAGVSVDVVQAFAGKVPLLGVCLGHQSIGQCFGMTVARHHTLMHGKTSEIHHDGQGLFAGLSNPFTAMRYHSLVLTRDSIDTERFEITAWCHENADTDQSEAIVMGLRAKPGAFGDAPVLGVQFHPESFMTTQGPAMLANFLGLPHRATATSGT